MNICSAAVGEKADVCFCPTDLLVGVFGADRAVLYR